MRPWCFPLRNRIISGLALATLVTEATLPSGTLTTARHAMDQGRDVMAVPGPISHLGARGCHQLIRDGAALVESSDDILALLSAQLGAWLDERRIEHSAASAAPSAGDTVAGTPAITAPGLSVTARLEQARADHPALAPHIDRRCQRLLETLDARGIAPYRELLDCLDLGVTELTATLSLLQTLKLVQRTPQNAWESRR